MVRIGARIPLTLSGFLEFLDHGGEGFFCVAEDDRGDGLEEEHFLDAGEAGVEAAFQAHDGAGLLEKWKSEKVENR